MQYSDEMVLWGQEEDWCSEECDSFGLQCGESLAIAAGRIPVDLIVRDRSVRNRRAAREQTQVVVRDRISPRRFPPTGEVRVLKSAGLAFAFLGVGLLMERLVSSQRR